MTTTIHDARIVLTACAASDGGDCSVAAYARAAEPADEARCQRHGGPTTREALRLELDRLESVAAGVLTASHDPVAERQWAAYVVERGREGDVAFAVRETTLSNVVHASPEGTRDRGKARIAHVVEHDPWRTILRIRAARAVTEIKPPQGGDGAAEWAQVLEEAVGELARGWIRP